MADSVISRKLTLITSLRFEKDQGLQESAAQIGKLIATATKNNLNLENLISNATSEFNRRTDNEGNIVGDTTKSSTDKTKKDEKEARAAALGKSSEIAQNIAKTGVNILKTTLGIVTDMLNRIKQASPLLQAVETLFNLAMQLFFMPLGTKLATVLIPAVTTLIDQVMQIWEGFEDKSLSQILEDTIHLGAEIFGEFFQNIGEDIAGGSDILTAIGGLIQDLGSFIKGHGESLVNKILNVVSFILDFLPQIVGIIVAFMVLSKALMIAQIITTAAINLKTAAVGAVALAGATTAGIIAGTAAANWATAADGGYFPATEGGVPVLLAEGGEGETVVPDSKKVDFAKAVMSSYTPKTNVESKVRGSSESGNTFNVYVTGYTDTDLSDKIIRVLNEQTNLSRLRSGF